MKGKMLAVNICVIIQVKKSKVVLGGTVISDINYYHILLLLGKKKNKGLKHFILHHAEISAVFCSND